MRAGTRKCEVIVLRNAEVVEAESDGKDASNIWRIDMRDVMDSTVVGKPSEYM